MFPILNKAVFNYSTLSIKLARRNLNLTGFSKKGRKTNNTKHLSDGLGFHIKEGNTGLVTTFTSKEDYGIFIHDGVNGNKSSYVANRDSKFRFKSNTKYANIGEIEKYIKSPKIRLRKVFKNSNGQKVSKFVPKNKENIKSAAFAMARSIAMKGIKSSPFMRVGAEEALVKSTPEMEKALVEDLESILISGLSKSPNITIKRT